MRKSPGHDMSKDVSSCFVLLALENAHAAPELSLHQAPRLFKTHQTCISLLILSVSIFVKRE